jgi:nucleoid-associated protein YgaU
VLLVLGVALGVLIGLVGFNALGRKTDRIPITKQKEANAVEPSDAVREAEKMDNHPYRQSGTLASMETMGSPRGVILKETEVQLPLENHAVAANGKHSKPVPPDPDISQEMTGHPSDFELQVGPSSWRTVTVKEGDTLRKLALDVYGQGDQTILNKVKGENPAIENVDLIIVGQTITFPPLSVSGSESALIESGS